MTQPNAERTLERRALFELWLANVVLGLIQAQVYRSHVPDGVGLKGLFFLNVALLAALAWTSGLVAGACAVLSRIGLRGRLLAGFSALVLTAYQVALFIDARSFDLFRYHFNGWVWTVITTPGGIADNIELGDGLWLMGCAIIVGTAVAMYLFQRWRTARLLGRAPSAGGLRYGWIVAALVIVPLLTEKVIYGVGNFVGDREITATAQLVPLYFRVTASKFLSRRLGLKLPHDVGLDHEKALLLKYPIARPKVRADGPRPNILIIVVESLRADMLSPEVMPFTWDFAKGGRRFTDHASGGNSTRYGTFTLIYGLHGSYFAPALAEHASPVLVDTLLDLGYEIKVYGTAQMTFPELRSTAWVKVQKQVEDGLESPNGSRDTLLVRRFTQWAETRPQNRPFFSFAFLDAPHFHYRVVPGRTPFQPYIESTDRAVLSSQDAAKVSPLLFNRYKDSVYDVDNSITLMLTALQRSGQLDNTIVVITGDHGEEFFEHRMWGHTGNFTYTQIQVPMVIRGPGVTPGVENAPTSHVDVAPTLLELLGADPAMRSQWTVGENMLAPAPKRDRVVASWEIVGTWTPDAIIVLPLNTYRGMPEVYDYDWKPMHDPEAVLKRSGDALRELIESTQRFMH